jgi:prevent-host-death family protein
VKATLTELHRQTKNVVRRASQGQTVQLTEHGRPVAKLSPDSEVRTITPEEFMKLEFTDEAILEAIREAQL